MGVEQQEAAAQFLAAARRTGKPGARLPEDIRPRDLDSALVIQRRVVALLGQAVGGWKCSVPSEARALNVAPIFASTIFRKSPCAIVTTGPIARIEPEVAFVHGPRPAAARHAVHRSGDSFGDRRAAPGAGTARHALRRSCRRELARDDGRLRAEPGTVRRPALSRRTRRRAANPSRSRSAHRPACCRRTTGATATVIRCGRCTGSRIFLPAATKACARARSSPPVPTPARSRFRSAQPLTVTFGDLGKIDIELRSAG